MEREELEALLADLESDRAERTVGIRDTDKFGQAICAFANDLPNHRKPGYLFVGAREDGTASGAVIDDQLLQNLAAIRSDGNVQPIPSMNVQKWQLGGGDVAVIEVFPHDLAPVRYKGLVWVRIGPRRGRASEADERLLSERRAARQLTWDARPNRDANLDDLALDLYTSTYRAFAVAREVVAENHRSVEEQLASLRFFDLPSGRPTNAGVLLFARDSRFFHPGAYVQVVAYEGRNQADPVAWEREIQGDFLSVCRSLDQLTQEFARVRLETREGSGQEQAVYDYPPRALRELFFNAVIHRRYEDSSTPIMVNVFQDRVEISNPGGLYGDLTPENLGRMTSYRNPVLAEAAKVLGYVNRFGRGLPVVKQELNRNGSPEPQFETNAGFFLVSVARRP